MKLDKLKAAFDSFMDTKVGRLKNQHKLIICLAAVAAPLLLFVFLYYSPKNKEIKGLQATKANLEMEIKRVEAIASQLDKHEAEMKATELKFKAASLLLPGQKEIPSLLTNISGLGTNSGLDFVSFKPQAESAKEFYAEIPVKIDVKGPYHNVGVFLDKVSKLPRIVTVSSISMGNPTIVDGEMFLNSSLDFVTYRFIESANVAKKQ